jgi:hypothetical protein
MRWFALAALLLLTACASKPAPPDWQANAHASLRGFAAAYFAGNARLADQEFARARADIASTGRLDLLARAELVRCAARVASLEFDDCPGFKKLAEDAAPQERAYAAFLAGNWEGLDASLLPEHHRALLSGKADAGELSGIDDPSSRLVAAGVLFRLGRLNPDGIAAATDTASANGWRRPLLAWLRVQAQRAETAGDDTQAARIRRRIDLVSGSATR